MRDFSAPPASSESASDSSGSESTESQSTESSEWGAIEDDEPDISEGMADAFEKDGKEDLIPKKQRERRKAEREAAEGKKPEGETKEEEKKETPPEKEEWELVVNGKATKYDPSNKAQLKADVQKGLAADLKFQEAAAIKKDAINLIHQLKTNPRRILEHPSLGIDFKAIAEEYVYEQIQLSKMTPEQRAEFDRQRQRDKELEDLRLEREERDRERNEQATQADVEKYRNRYSQEIPDAIKKSGLPDSKFVRERVANYLLGMINKGHVDITAYDVMAEVIKDYKEEQRALYNSLPDDKLLEVLGPEAADKVRQANLKKMQGSKPQAQLPKPPAPQAQPKTDKPKEEPKVYRSINALLNRPRR